jgi:hypothetical protein
VTGLGAAGVLTVWEQGRGLGSTAQALLLLKVAQPEAGWEDLAALPLSERDRRLFALRAATLGPGLESVARCPACGEAAEIDLDSLDLLAGLGERSEDDTLSFTHGDLALTFRRPTSADLLAAGRTADLEAARRELATRAVVTASRKGEPIAAGDLGEAEILALAGALAEADPGAEIWLDVACPACGHGRQVLFDIASFFAAELGREAERLLADVQALAAAYGWTEAAVLALSPRRRRFYLEGVGA